MPEFPGDSTFCQHSLGVRDSPSVVSPALPRPLLFWYQWLSFPFGGIIPPHFLSIACPLFPGGRTPKSGHIPLRPVVASGVNTWLKFEPMSISLRTSAATTGTEKASSNWDGSTALGDSLEDLGPSSGEKLPRNGSMQRTAALKHGKRQSPNGLCKPLDLAIPEAI